MSESSELDNSLIQFLLDAFYRSAIDPSSRLFLPTLIQGQQNPTYEPYDAGTWTPMDLTDLSAASTVCSSQGGASENYIVTPNTSPALMLDNVMIAGISNALPRPATVTDDTVTVSASLSTYPSSIAPAPLAVTGTFGLTQHCCPTSDFKTCASPSQDFVGSGTFSVTIAASTATASFLVGVDAQGLTATVQNLQWEAAATPANITATVDILSIPKNANRDIWNKYAEQALNSAIARSQLVTSIQHVLAQQSTRDSLSALITAGLQSLNAQAAHEPGDC